MSRFLVYLGVFLCASCASAPIPTLPPPPLFSGEAGWEGVEGSAQLVSERVATGEVFMQRQGRFKRTGTINGAVTSSTIWGTTTWIEEGASMYAVHFDGSALYGPGYANVAWCSPGNPSASGLSNFWSGARASTCLSWARATGDVSVLQGNARDSAFFSNRLTVGNVDADYPDITETGDILDAEFYFTGRFIRIIPYRHITVQLRFEDSLSRGKTVLKTIKVSLEDDGTAIWEIWGGKLKLIPVGEDSISIEVMEPLQDEILDYDDILEQILQELQKSNEESSGKKPKEGTKGKE